MIPTWNLLNEAERFDTLRAMETYGGSFVNALARAWRYADANNSRRLGEMFADFVAAYGPGTGFYESAQRQSRQADPPNFNSQLPTTRKAKS